MGGQKVASRAVGPCEPGQDGNVAALSTGSQVRGEAAFRSPVLLRGPFVYKSSVTTRRVTRVTHRGRCPRPGRTLSADHLVAHPTWIVG